MHRAVLAMIALAGCDFEHGASADLPDAGGYQGHGDAAVGPPSPPHTCHVADPALRLCLDFEDATLTPVARDASGMHNDAQAAQIQSMPRGTQQAALATYGSQLAVPEVAALDISPDLTIEMWLQPDSPFQSAQLLANDSQYALLLDVDTPLCKIGGMGIHANATVDTGTWSHVACTYDGRTLKVYVDGNLSGCVGSPAPAAIPTGGNAGTVIASNYLGGIDDVHVYAKTLSDQALCGLAGQTKCDTGCPQ